MKSAQIMALVAGAAMTVSAQDYSPFSIDYLYTHEPNGNPAGQVNYYNIAFNVTSTNGDDAPKTQTCSTFWGDNGLAFCSPNCVPYSTNVPTGEWMPCAQEEGAALGEFSFQLYPYFSIGNFSMAIRQNFTETVDGTPTSIIATTDPYQVTNTTGALKCDINPTEVPYQQHAQGDCNLAPSSTISMPIATATSACPHATSVTLSFPVEERTAWGDHVFVVGNVTELGNWDPYNAVALNADSWTSTNDVWTGGDVVLLAGTPFEYKFIQWSAQGDLLWECGDNWVWTVGEFTCGTEDVTAGGDPTWFRCGDH